MKLKYENEIFHSTHVKTKRKWCKWLRYTREMNNPRAIRKLCAIFSGETSMADSWGSFFFEREILLISSTIHQGDTSSWNFSDLCLTDSLKDFDKEPSTLMTVNPKTRPPPICPDKKILGHLFQEMRCRYKIVLQSMLLKDSPRTEPVRSWVNNLQKERFFVIEHHSISA